MLAAPVAAVDLSLGSAVTVPGGSASIALELALGGGVSHFQVDVLFDPAILTPGTPTPGNGVADHVLDWAIVAPGTLRIVLYSPSCAPLGAEIALLPFTAAPDSPVGTEDVVLANAMLVGGDGEPVASTALLDGTIEIRDAAAVPEIPTLSPLGGAGLALLLVGLALLLLRRRHSRGGAALAVVLAVVGAAAAGRAVAAITPQAVVDAILGRSASDPSLDCNSDSVVDVRDVACLLEPGCTAPTPTPTASASATPSPTATATPTATPTPPATTPTTTPTPTFDDNQAPVLAPPGNQETGERSLFALQLEASDPDLARGDVLRFSLLVRPTGLTVDPATGALLWSPTEGQTGIHDVTARVVDLSGLSDEESFQIVVTELGGPPVLAPIADQSTVEDLLLALAASASDPDLPDDVLTFSLPLAPAGMTIDGATGAIAWTPGAAQVGLHDVTVEVSDQQGLLDFTSFIVTVGSTNEAPVANDDAYVVRTGEALLVGAPGVLENDSDPNGDPLSTVLVDPPAQGDLELHADGSFEYTPTLVGRIEESIDLTRLTLPLSSASSARSTALMSERVVDGNLATSWFTSTSDTDAYLAVDFDRPVAVREILYFGDRQFPASTRDFTSGVFELFDGDGALLFSSGEVALPLPSRDVVVDVEGAAGSPVMDVRRVLFRATGYEGTGQHGFAELSVIGDGIAEVLLAVEEWSWTAASIPSPTLSQGQVLVAPTVGDLDGDGLPEVVFIAEALQRLYVANGEDGSIAWSADNIQGFSSSPVLGDVDGDGRMEVVAVRYFNSATIAVFEDDGTFKTEINTGLTVEEGNLALADLDGDGVPEIIVPGSSRIAAYHLEAGVLVEVWESANLGCANNAYRTNCIPLVADVDLDGSPDIVAGRVIYDANGGTKYHDPLLPDGWNAVGNFDDDPFAEIVLVSVGLVRLLEHDLTVKWGPVDPPGAGNLGPPTVADFDGDGQAEIGIAGSNRYFVLEGDGSVLWEAVTVDASSNRTGSTVFDFQNDGSAEVIYRDEDNLWVFRGSDGRVVFQTDMGSTTTVEYPVVADIDADGEAEIVVASDVTRSGGIRPPGLYVFGSANGDWVRARPIWNQHTYHVTNVLPDGTVPAIEQINWLLPGLNNFRKNDFLPDEASRADTFTYRANDGVFDSNVATVFLDLRPPNTAPEIVSDPDTTATSGIEYLYAARAVDLDFDPLVFALGEGPAGMTIDPATGLLRWTPGPGDLGEHLVSLSVTDDDGFSGLQVFTLTVAEPVEVPDVVGLDLVAADAALVGASLATGNVSQANHPTIAAGLVIAQTPAAGSIAEPGSAVALVESLGPAPEDIDDDGDGFTENQGDPNDDDPTIYPGAPEIPDDGIDQNGDGVDGTVPPVAIEVVPGALTLLQGETAALQAFGIFADGSAQNITALVAWSSTNGAAVGVSPAGVVSALSAGMAQIQAMSDGVTGSASVSVKASDDTDDQAPGAQITSPAEGATVPGMIDVSGTATDPGFVRYELAIAPVDENTFTLISEGASPVVAGVLGQLDPTVLLNDLYRLRLTVLDAGGNETIDEVTVQVEGGQKVGNFTLSFSELSIPMSGIPIEVVRTYDSRDRRRGDFGFGWRLSVKTLEFTCTGKLGEGWTVVKSGLAYALVRTREQACTLALSDGRVERFDLVTTPASSAIVPFSFLTAKLQARPGTLGTLQVLDNTFLAIVDPQPGEVLLLDDTTFNVFAPNRFRYTSPDGTQVVLSRANGVESIRDTNGNTLTFGPGGITHSAGLAIAFGRDGQGRITSLTDPAGEVQTYSYSAAGDLVAHEDPLGNTTRFFYDHRHGLVRIVDPLGRPALRNEYDEQGRLVRQLDALGNAVVFEHELNARRERVTDRLGHTTTYEYDERGNLTVLINALGHRWERTYDALDNPLTEKNPLGQVTTATYDPKGRPLTITDPLGGVTQMTYDSAGRPLTITDPAGNQWVNTYDARGNPLTSRDPEGNETSWTYDASGDVTSVRNAEGAITSFTYDSNGYLTSWTSAEGVVRTVDVDANGRITGENYTLVTGAGPLAVDWSYEYDGAGHVTAIQSPLGEEASTLYDANGQLVGATNPELEWSLERDVLGRPRSATVAGIVTAVTTYDAEGRALQADLPGGLMVKRSYDAVGHTLQNQLPGAAPSTLSWDAAGRLGAVVDASGLTQTYHYDANNRLVKTDLPGGADVTTTYDPTGAIESVTDASGATFTFDRDRNGQVTELTLPDGMTMTSSYDGEGRLVSRTDLHGLPWAYEYSPDGVLTGVHAADGTTATFGHNSDGLLDRVTDGRGNTMLMLHDQRGRDVGRVLPGGQSEQCSLDSQGRQVSCSDFDGSTYAFVYDDLARTTTRTASDGVEVSTVDGLGRLLTVTNIGGLTQLTYDAGGRRTGWSDPGGLATTFGYDGGGRLLTVSTGLTTTTLAYDPRGFVAAATGPDGVITFARDDTGRPLETAFADGTKILRSYDTVGRLLTLEYEATGGGIEGFTYSHDANGRISGVATDSGRVVSYEYDGMGRLGRETTSIGGPPAVIEYEYDAAGNLSARNDASGDRVFSYDENDRLLSDGVWTYGWDDNGSLVSRTDGTRSEVYTYDSQQRLVHFERTGSSPAVIAYAYAADGLLLSRTLDGVASRFVWDRVSGALPQLIEVRNASGALLRRYEYQDGLPLRMFDATLGERVLVSDHLGTVHALAAGGAITQAAYSDAFGRRATDLPTDLGYLGAYRDPVSGLVFLHHRWYSPEIARFTQMDPAAADLMDSRSLNRYAYAFGDPVNRADRNGLEPSIQGITIASGIVTTLTTAFAVHASIKSLGTEAALRTGFGFTLAFNKNHQLNAYYAPPTAEVGAGFGGFSVGFGTEALRFIGRPGWSLYGYFSSGLSTAATGGGSVTGGTSLGPVYDTPSPAAYTGWFFGFTLSGPSALLNKLQHPVAKKIFGSSGQFTVPSRHGKMVFSGQSALQATAAWSPTITFCADSKTHWMNDTPAPCRGAEPRVSHAVRFYSARLSASVKVPKGGSAWALGVSVSYYWWLGDWSLWSGLTPYSELQ